MMRVLTRIATQLYTYNTPTPTGPTYLHTTLQILHIRGYKSYSLHYNPTNLHCTPTNLQTYKPYIPTTLHPYTHALPTLRT